MTPWQGCCPPLTMPLKKVLRLVDVRVQSHLSGVFQRSHQLPLKGQQPWGLERLINNLAKEIQLPEGQTESALEGDTQERESATGRLGSRPLREEGKVDGHLHSSYVREAGPLQEGLAHSRCTT